MGRLSVLRRYSVPWPSSIWRLPEAPDGLLSDKIGQLSTQARPAAGETIGRRAFESSRPFASCFRSPTIFFPSLVFGRRTDYGLLTLRRYSTINDRDDSALEEEVERKAGWLLKAIFIVTAVGVASQFFPYMGDNLLQQSISLLHVKDPLFKRMGASRLRRFAIDDERRMKVVEMGGAQDLLIMLEGAKDDKTRKEALKALLALSYSDSSEFDEIGNCKSSLLKRLREFQKMH